METNDNIDTIKTVEVIPKPWSPSIKSEEAIEKILTLVGKGETVQNACRSQDLSRETFYKWMKLEGNKERYYTALDERTEDIIDTLYSLCKKGDKLAIFYWLNNRVSDRWANRVKQEISADVKSHSLILDELEDGDE